MLCEKLVASTSKPKLRIAFIENSITSGAWNDLSENARGSAQWNDQNNAYMIYGAITARKLNVHWQLSSVSGIGLMHSTQLPFVMPNVYSSIKLTTDTTANPAL
jgi:hypothetical protein